MNGISFSIFNKSDDMGILNALFDILYDNMHVIAPTGNSYAVDKQAWLSYILSDLENPNRRIVLINVHTKLAGYFMYSLRNTTFMMEDIQFMPRYQGVGIFRKLYRFVFTLIPQDVKFVEAQANKENFKSQGICNHFGLQCIGVNKNGKSFRYRGLYQDLKERILSTCCYCGRDCSKCVTYIATQNNDDALRAKAQKFYKETFKMDIPLKKINCDGGRSDNVITFCKECPFAKCCKKKNIASCSECPKYPCRDISEYQQKYGKKCDQI